MTHPLYIVDVFAERPYSGNQLAVVGGLDLGDEAMQRIALEMNFSETTFVAPTPEADGGYRTRIFTPTRELPFAGHPILGTAWVIRALAPKPLDRLHLNLAVGPVEVTFETSSDQGDLTWFRAPPVKLEAECPRPRIAAALGIAPDDIDRRFPPRQLSAGTAAVIVPLVDLAALRRCRLDLAAFAPLAEAGFSSLVYAFCPQARRPENHLSARFFFDAGGVREDPATGSATAFLGNYLLEHRYFPDPELSLRIEQGHEIGRPSLLRLGARGGRGGAEVRVGGQVVATVRGELL
jgi:trans-2,3-dihydro-3-hydroxyanthranilate isomerase